MTIATLLLSHGERVSITAQPWGATWKNLEPGIVETLAAVQRDTPVFGVELAGPNPWAARNIDHHRYSGEDRSNPQSSLEQVASVLGIELDRYQRLVAANDRAYIPGMREAGASPEEIAAIRSADRAAQGIGPEEELRAEREIRNAHRLPSNRWVVECVRPSSAHTDRLFGLAAEVLLTGQNEWLYTGPRYRELNGLALSETHWSGGSPESGYFGIKSPAHATQTRIMDWFE